MSSEITLPNKPSTAPSASFFIECAQLTKRLYTVPGFEVYLDTPDFEKENETPGMDPVSTLWKIFRLGTPLCYLFNLFEPKEPLSMTVAETINARKAAVYHFLLALKKELQLKECELFTISELFNNDTNGFVKVMRTLYCVLDRLEELGVKTLERPIEAIRRPSMLRTFSMSTALSSNTDGTKAKTFSELVETERKYVADLEKLKAYMDTLQEQAVLSMDVLQSMFLNLNALIDFQRKFLVGIEACSLVGKGDQNAQIGNLFIHMEEGFSVYEPICANYENACELGSQEIEKLSRASDLVEPVHELPSLLIKPIQRICRYPLLLVELKRLSKEDDSGLATLDEGILSIKRVADRINEKRRKEENVGIMHDLEKRVNDWKGYNIHKFGQLLLQEIFSVSNNGNDRDMHVFLFEKIILFCKERTTSKTLFSNKKKYSYNLKGTVFVNSITGVIGHNRPNAFTLKVFWNDLNEMESFILNCRTEEQLTMWQNVLEDVSLNARKRYSANRRIDRYKSSEGFVKGHGRKMSTSSTNSQPRAFFSNEDDEHDEQEYEQTLRDIYSLRSPTKQRNGSFSTFAGLTPATSPTRPEVFQHRSAGSMGAISLPKDAHSLSLPPLPKSKSRETIPMTRSASSISRVSNASSTKSNAAMKNMSLTPISEASSAPCPPIRQRSSSVSVPRIQKVHLKLHQANNTFALVVDSSISYALLLEKISKKVQMCARLERNEKRMKITWKDEDGDFVSLNSDEDVIIAFMESGGQVDGVGLKIVELFLS